MTVIGVSQLTKRFGALTVLNDVNLSVRAGEFLVVRGPSGCGKTTLLRCLALLERIDAGVILHAGDRVLRAGERPRPLAAFAHGIAMVFQELHLWPHLSVLENVLLPLRQSDGTKSAGIAAQDALRATGLLEKARDYPIALSGGQRQRLALARVLGLRPRILLLDEITANLDSETAAEIIRLVEDMNRRGITIVMATHAKQLEVVHSTFTYVNGTWKHQTPTDITEGEGSRG
jgi:ABC-type polar amino acid transport system ATPase subunit